MDSPQNLKIGSFIRIVQNDKNGGKKYGYFEIVDTDIDGTAPLPNEIAEKPGFAGKERCIRVRDWASDGHEGSMVSA